MGLELGAFIFLLHGLVPSDFPDSVGGGGGEFLLVSVKLFFHKQFYFRLPLFFNLVNQQ